MKAVLYARVSSEKQAEKDLSISSQLKAGHEFAARRDYEVVREFVDEAESARTADRPAFQEMISLAKQKKRPFDVIIVWKLSRFARNREDSIIYKSLLRRNGVHVVSMNEQIDDTPAGQLFEGMIEVIDEFYSANLAQDTKRGMRENASRGFYNGGYAPMGYKREKVRIGTANKNRLVVDQEHSPTVKRIFEMAIAGKGAKEIVNTLNAEGITTNRGKKWNKNLVLYILRNEVYTGTLVFGKSDPGSEPVRRENNHTALVSVRDFQKVQSLIEQRSPKYCRPRTLTSDYLLSGIIYCGECGYALQGCSAKSGQFHYYACHNSIRKGKTTCSSKMVNRDRIEFIVIDKLKKHVLTEENLTELLELTNQELENSRSGSEDQIATMDAELAKQERKLNNLYGILETGKLDIDDIAPRLKELRASIDQLKLNRSALQESSHAPIKPLSKRQLTAYVKDLANLLMEGSIFERKGFIRSFVKRIDVTGDEVKITYTYPVPDDPQGSDNDGGDGVLSSAQVSSPNATLLMTVLQEQWVKSTGSARRGPYAQRKWRFGPTIFRSSSHTDSCSSEVQLRDYTLILRGQFRTANPKRIAVLPRSSFGSRVSWRNTAPISNAGSGVRRVKAFMRCSFPTLSTWNQRRVAIAVPGRARTNSARISLGLHVMDKTLSLDTAINPSGILPTSNCHALNLKISICGAAFFVHTLPSATPMAPRITKPTPVPVTFNCS